MKRESSRPFLSAGLGGDVPDELADLVGIPDAAGYLHNDGQGNFTYSVPEVGLGPSGPVGSLGEVGDALQLFWLYGDQSPNFEMFGTTFSWRDIAPIAVTEATAGDDTLDLDTTEGLKVGKTYVISNAAGTLIETIEVSKILNPKRLRARLSLSNTLNAASGARLARTSAEVLDRFAIFSHGDAFYTRILDALRLQDRGRVMLRRSSDGAGTFSVSYRLAGDVAWLPAKRTEVRSRRTGTRDEEYAIPIGGEIELRVTYAGANANDKERVEFMVLATVPRADAAAWVEQPVNAAPAAEAINVGQTPVLTGSAYRSLYGLEQGGAHFQVARDALFTDVVVNSSNDWLASWVNKSGYSQNWTGVVALAEGKFLAVANAVSVRLDGTGAITVTGMVTGDLRCVAADTGLAVAAGAAGAIRTSADEGATYTTRTAANAYGGTFNGATVRGSRVALVGTAAEIEFAANGVIFSKVAVDGAYAGDFTAVANDGAGNVIAVGSNGGIQTSNNDGQGNWTKRDAPGGYVGTYRAVEIMPSGYGLTAGDNGALHETFDYGATWRNANPDPAFAGRFTAVTIAGTYAVAVGESGAIQVKVLPNGKWQARSTGGGITGAFRALALDPNADALALGDAGLAQRTSRLTGATITYTVPAGSDMLQTNKVYFWRVRYSDTLNRWSPWSTGTSFATSTTFNYVRQPDNLSPANGDDAVSVVPTLQAGAFSVVGAPDTHAKSRWQVARDLAFADIAHDSGEVNDLTAYTLPAGSPLVDQQTYFWRVAYKGAADGFSAWSAPTSFKTRARPNKPAITAPAANATNVAIAPTITTSAFSMPGGGVHDASRYQLSTTSSFASIAYDSGWTTTDKLSHTLPAGTLAFNTAYYVRAQHRESGGQASSFSDVVAFTTVKKPTVQDVFATTIYTSNGNANQLISTNFDPDLVWQKSRTTTGTSDKHFLTSTAIGSYYVSTDSPAGQAGPVTAGYALPTVGGFFGNGANNGRPVVGWAWKNADKFFKVLKFNQLSGAPSTFDLSNLGAIGFAVVKCLSASSDWYAWHRSLPANTNMKLNDTADQYGGTPFYISVAGTTLTFSSGAPSGAYELLAWAHDPAADGLIQCGTYVGNGFTGPVIPLGWEPQWLVLKKITSNVQANWNIMDNQRISGANELSQFANLAGEDGYPTDFVNWLSNGFQPLNNYQYSNQQNETFIYVAIRKP